MKIYNIGIIGLGAIAHAYAKSLVAVPNANLYAVGSRSTDKANKFKRTFDADVAYGSYKELFEDKLVDIVYIATPMSSHYKDMINALESNKHILCEKSFTLNANEAKHIFEIAKRKNLFVMEALWSRFNPTLLEVRELIDEGLIGKITKVDLEFSIDKPYDETSRLYNKELGGGALLDVGIYPITFTDMMIGLNYKTIKSSAELAPTKVDQSNKIELDFEKLSATLTSGFDKQGLNFGYIYGTTGYMLINDFWANQYAVVIKDKKIVKVISNPFLVNGLEYQTIHVLECLDKSLVESNIMPPSKTIEIMTFMDSLRKAWGITYLTE